MYSSSDYNEKYIFHILLNIFCYLGAITGAIFNLYLRVYNCDNGIILDNLDFSISGAILGFYIIFHSIFCLIYGAVLGLCIGLGVGSILIMLYILASMLIKSYFFQKI